MDAERPTGRERDRSLITLANCLIFHDFAEEQTTEMLAGSGAALA